MTAAEALAQLIAEGAVEIIVTGAAEEQVGSEADGRLHEAQCRKQGEGLEHIGSGLFAALSLGGTVHEHSQGNRREDGNDQGAGQQRPVVDVGLRHPENGIITQDHRPEQQSDEAADHRCGQEEFLEQFDLGPQEGPQQKQAADNGKAAEQLGKKRRCKHDNFLQITKNGTVLCIAQSLHNSL